jgi:Uma2 family endonuclease
MAVSDQANRKLTYEDWLRFPEDGQRHEILDGRHYVTATPTLGHQGASGNLYLILAPFVREHRLGRIYYAPVGVILSPHDIVEPDLLFVSNRRAGILTEAIVQGAPDLAIEILSPSTRRRDETLKRDRYELWGVEEYWLVDGRRQLVCVYRRSGAGFGAPEEFFATAGDVLTTPLLPGLEIRVADIFVE